MIARKLICPVIALATIATMVAEEIDPEKAAPVDESLMLEGIRRRDRGGGREDTAGEIMPETVEETAEETAGESAPESATPDADETTEDAGETAEEPVEETRNEEAQAEPELLEEEPPGDPAPGLAVRVEKLQSGDQAIDPAQVRMLAPFPAKLLAQTPAGWRIESSESAPHFTREVELAPASTSA